MTELKLFEKTELYINNIQLTKVNLSTLAATAASVLELPKSDVAVVDVRSETIIFDILRDTVTLEQILGKEKALLVALGSVEGVTVTDKTRVGSEGQLGFIARSENYNVTDLSRRIEKISKQVNYSVQHRVIIFPTGEEIIEGRIEDTNTPFLVNLLGGLGYQVSVGKPLEDCIDKVIGALSGAVDMGYGLVITTGGVGAEDKDHIVEAVLALDREAATPYVAHYTPGFGRHKKDGIRIAVGRLESTTFVALPGPNDEVQLVGPVLKEGLRQQWDKAMLAEKLAKPLRAKLAPPSP
jgi:molybdenum cofactor synthesis domain-containing protein